MSVTVLSINMSNRLPFPAGICVLCLALMTTSTPQATESFPSWETRTPGHPSAVSYAPTEWLHELCPDFVKPLADRGARGGFTAECEVQLDKIFLNEIPPLMPIHAQDNRISWQYVFDQPLAKREIVLDVLAKPECRMGFDVSTQGMPEDCRVDALVDYAVLKYQCAAAYFENRQRIEDGIVHSWLDNFSIARLFEDEAAAKRRMGPEWAYFRFAWVVAKCAGVPSEALASLGEFENTLTFAGEPKVGEEGWWWAEQGFEAYELMGIAAQLSENVQRTSYGYNFDSRSTWQMVEPVMAELIQIKELADLTDSDDSKVAQLKHLISTQVWKTKRRTRVDETWLLSQFGEYSNEELQKATDGALAMMKEQGVGTKWN